MSQLLPVRLSPGDGSNGYRMQTPRGDGTQAPPTLSLGAVGGVPRKGKPRFTAPVALHGYLGTLDIIDSNFLLTM